MNRKVMRKSTLISSIAMLLVAVLALSGVTFAWFSAQPTATAGNLTMRSSAAAGLQIAKVDDHTSSEMPSDWRSSVEWNDPEFTLTPVSCAFPETEDDDGEFTGIGTQFFKTTSTNEDGTWDTVTKIEPAYANQEYIAKKIWIKGDIADGFQADLKVKINFGANSTTKLYQRVAFVNLTDNTYKIYSTTARTYAPFVDEKGPTVEKTEIIDGEQVITYKTITSEAAGNTITNTLIDDYAGGEKEFLVLFFIEGQDSECYNGNSVSTATIDFTFTLGELSEIPAEGN